MTQSMKRFLVLLCAALLLAACHDASQDPVIKGYRIERMGGMGLSADGVAVDLTLALDVENPGKAVYTVESLEAIVYKGMETARFAEAVLTESASIPAKTTQTVNLPLHVRLLRPLALLSDQGLDLSQYCADVDLTIRKGSLKKRIQRERVPLAHLEQLLVKAQTSQSNENE